MTKIAAWDEVLGTVEEIGDDSITLLCTKKVTLRIRAEDLRKRMHLLRPGRLIGVLVLEDGSVRVRLVKRRLPARLRDLEIRQRDRGG